MTFEIEKQLRENGFYVSTTVGVSMWPMLRNRRDRVILRPLEAGERLSRFDLPLYRRSDGKYVLHRIVGVKDDHYLIRGDNTFAKEKVMDSQIIGVVSEFYRKDRHIFANSKKYRAYACFWNAIYFLRMPMHKAHVLVWRVLRKLGAKPKWWPYGNDI
jgi:hypothetical protein